MYYSAQKMLGFSLHAMDGTLGKVVDYYFEDQSWFLRYVVVELGVLRSRQVLVAAPLLGPIDPEFRTIDVHLTMAQVEESPELSSDETLMVRHEEALFAHYGWPSYWNGYSFDEQYGAANTWLPHPAELGLDSNQVDPHVRSMLELVGYKLEAQDGTAGRIDDLVLDDEVWAVRYLVTRTQGWLSGRKVLVLPDWVETIHREEGEVLVDHNTDDVRNSQELLED